MEKLRFGIVGAGGRPRAFLDAFERSGRAVLVAVCDKNKDAMAEAVAGLDGVAQYTDYGAMLEDAGLDAVIVGTPMPLHVPQSIAALEKGIHVFSEVMAAVSVEECRALLEACRRSSAQYMMGENCCYFRANMIARELVRSGALGEPFYAEGEYNHDCRSLITATPWRKTWLYDVPGVTYGSHALGPILSWLDGDRVTQVLCVGSGDGLPTLDGEPLTQQAGYTMLCRTVKGRLIKLRQNLSSPRPYGLNYKLEGSRGAFISCVAGTEHRDEVWLQGISAEQKWDRLTEREADYLPELWRRYAPQVAGEGHGDADVITMIDFINALADGRRVPIDIYASLDMTLPGLIGQASVRQGSVWLDVPDPREW